MAGRTDSGVHALGQVAAFRTDSKIAAEQFRPGLQAFLPDDIVVVETCDVHPEFHATYWAERKRYRYIMHDARVLSPFVARYVSDVGRRLNVEAMQTGARHLLGTHDFRCFESHFPNKATSVRTVLDVSVRRTGRWVGWSPMPMQHAMTDDAVIAFDDAFVCLEIEADGFLYNMVRAIAGSLIRVGLGQWEPDRIETVIRNQDRSQAGHTAPPQGLYLVSVHYRDAP